MNKTIVIYRGDEYRAKISDKIYENELFANLYISAFKILNEIVHELHGVREQYKEGKFSETMQGMGNNIIVFSGQRGQGKTSIMQSFSKFLPTIDPSSLSKGESIVQSLITKLFYLFSEYVKNSNESYSSEQEKKIDKLRKDAVPLFQKCFTNIDYLKLGRNKEWEIDDLEQLSEISNSAAFKNNLRELIDVLLNNMCYSENGKSFLIIPIDDTDLATLEAFNICEDIRNYFSIPNVIVLMAADYRQLTYAVTQQYLVKYQKLRTAELGDGFKDNDCYEIVVQYLEKVLPSGHRIDLPQIDAIIKENREGISFRYIEKVGSEKVELFNNSYGNAKGIHNQLATIKHFYVIHFPKSEFTENEFKKYNYFEKPRNHKIRYIIEKQAKAIVKYLDLYHNARNRVKGVDACSTEIGCRPETFATEYRYIRGCTYNGIRIGGAGTRKIGMTYHVGEDFLDISDGLRAIDEALRFLELEKGDRLGHALALGIDSESFYRLKKYNVYVTKQDCLDNLVWILYRSLELNIDIDLNNRTIMTETARELFYEIYSKWIGVICYGDILDSYYQSWKLRGDYPWTYNSTGFNADYAELRYDDYSDYMLQQNLSQYRKNEVVSRLYYLYHFNKQVKLEGLKPKAIMIEDWYVNLVDQLQSAMIKEVYKKGLSIECNPTSNVLISTFGYYERHPILRFNNYYLEDAKDSPNIQVSINTDDLGVFDTSLANEYALMFRAIQMKRHREGNYDDDSIYRYLNYVRENGRNMIFK